MVWRISAWDWCAGSSRGNWSPAEPSPGSSSPPWIVPAWAVAAAWRPAWPPVAAGEAQPLWQQPAGCESAASAVVQTVAAVGMLAAVESAPGWTCRQQHWAWTVRWSSHPPPNCRPSASSWWTALHLGQEGRFKIRICTTDALQLDWGVMNVGNTFVSDVFQPTLDKLQTNKWVLHYILKIEIYYL